MLDGYEPEIMVTASDLSPAEMKQLHVELQALARAIRGAPLEGNYGVLQRLERVERKTAWLMISLIPAVTVGTAGGRIVSDWLGF